MNKAIVRWWRRLRYGRMLDGQQAGQSLVIIAFAFIGILAFVGLAIDLGWVYVQRVRVAQAADAAALAGASELPLEPAARTRALVYLQENGYDYTEGDVRLVVDGSPVSGPSEEQARAVIWMDSAYSRDTSRPPVEQLNTADRLRVRVRQRVFMTFMQFIGFRFAHVEATAEAENINNIDTVIVYDRSGSMEFDTLCYGCWEQSAEQYPNGNVYPLPWSTSTIEAADHCSEQNVYYSTRNRTYFVIEAEEYSRLNMSLDPSGLAPYQSFWVLQRNTTNCDEEDCPPGPLSDVGALGRDERGAYISHHPFSDYVQGTGGAGVACTWADLTSGEFCRRGLPAGGPFPAPRADYDFTVPPGQGGNYYIHIRGQGGAHPGNQHIFWGMDGAPLGQESFRRGPYYDGAVQSNDDEQIGWEWRRLSRQVYLSAGPHTLNLWAGGAGFDVDRIIITNNAGNSNAVNNALRGLGPNNGRTGWACNPCDPRFAGRPGGYQVTAPDGTTFYYPDCSAPGNPDLRYDAIYDDEQPIRDALEAARGFVRRLNPRFDQIGYVRYSTTAQIASELQCIRRLGSDGCTSDVITNTVLYELDRTRSGGSTNIADGMRLGIQVLGTGAPHYGRPAAAHVMVVMTDGEANKQPNSVCDDQDLWPDQPDDTSEVRAAKDCVMYYAQQARDNAVIIYTIGLGESADRELMMAVAELTGGFYRGADSREELDNIFNELYERIFLRLIH